MTKPVDPFGWKDYLPHEGSTTQRGLVARVLDELHDRFPQIQDSHLEKGEDGLYRLFYTKRPPNNGDLLGPEFLSFLQQHLPVISTHHVLQSTMRRLKRRIMSREPKWL